MRSRRDTNNLRASSGFTLIEILIVMVIIGILAMLGFGSFQSSQQKGRDARRKSDLSQISRALETYFNDKGTYPMSTGDGLIIGCGEATLKIECAWGEEFTEPLTGYNDTVYMVKLPSDPKAPSFEYVYMADGSGLSYQLYTRLENTLDAAIAKDVDDNPQAYTDVSCGDRNCNYGISSPNTSPDEDRVIGPDE